MVDFRAKRRSPKFGSPTAREGFHGMNRTREISSQPRTVEPSKELPLELELDEEKCNGKHGETSSKRTKKRSTVKILSRREENEDNACHDAKLAMSPFQEVRTLSSRCGAGLFLRAAVRVARAAVMAASASFSVHVS